MAVGRGRRIHSVAILTAAVTTIVYWIAPPGVYVAEPSVFVICKSATDAAVSVSVAHVVDAHTAFVLATG